MRVDSLTAQLFGRGLLSGRKITEGKKVLLRSMVVQFAEK
jgi:hypothetical protein